LGREKLEMKEIMEEITIPSNQEKLCVDIILRMDKLLMNLSHNPPRVST